MAELIDEAGLKSLLAAAGSRLSPREVNELVDGVLAAGPTVDAAGWHRLVASEPGPALIAALDALKAAKAAAHKPFAGRIEDRLAALRKNFVSVGVDGFIVPRADAYQNEYVPAANQRLAWITGFTGSAGTAVVLAERAAIFVDGRYTVQVRAEVDPALFEIHNSGLHSPESWITEALKPGEALGYDSWVLTPAQAVRFREAAERAGARLEAVDNPLDAAWTDRPPQPLGPVTVHETRFAGQSSAEKRAALAAALRKDGRHAAVLTMADSIAWLLNIRGADVSCTPLPLSYAILRDDASVDLFVDPRKLLPGLEAYFGNEIATHAPEAFGPTLDALAGKTVQVDPTVSPAWVFERLTAAGARIAEGADPCRLPKAVKNEVELGGTRTAHRRDATAMAGFLAWLDAVALKEPQTESSLADRLDAFRAEGAHFRDVSFPTISAAGPNAALPHYRVAPETDRALEAGTFYLVDSGAQYLDGTTDLTRTIAIGEPSAEMKDRYTRVLKGHIALARLVFPKGTTGSAVDALARLPLWQAGLDFDHGTGHGVGSYLSVHEGPQRISPVPNTQALLPGMIVSNEPGYYKEGHYGIRIENLIVVQPVEIPGAERQMFGFETITFCPIDRRGIEPKLLTEAEVAWLDAYHAKTREIVLPTLSDPAARQWLERETRPLLSA